MTKFKLQSDYLPTGDQPAAIAQLTDGIKKGEKHQTLLGVTGSGKSVVGNSKILISSYGKSYFIEIKKLQGIFDGQLPPRLNASQVATISAQLSSIAFNDQTGVVSDSRVSEISRHRYGGCLYAITTSCGRSNQFTGSHNVYVLRNGAIKLLPSDQLKVGDMLPVPDGLPENQAGMEQLDMRDWLPEDVFYVSVSYPETIPVGVLNREKSWRVLHEGERVSLKSYRLFEFSSADTMTDRVGSNKRHATIPVVVRTSHELWRFFGLYIAEGHAERNYITLSTADESIVDEFLKGAVSFGLKLAKRQKPYDYQISGKVLASLMSTLCGACAGEKRLPMFWPQLSNAQLAEMISGVFAGDGWVESNSVCLASSSHELVHDIQCALMRFGVHARVKPKKVVYKGGLRPSWVLRICGRADLTYFQREVGFSLRRKDAALSKMLAKEVVANTNVNIFPLDNALVCKLCAEYGLYQRDLAAAMGVSRSIVSMYLAGLRSPSRQRARRLFSFLLEKAIRDEITASVSELEQLIGLTNLFWSPIADISKRTVVDEVVYDLTIPEGQTFLAGGGGYFVHNTFSMANVIQNIQKPTLVLSHNKTLAAQLYGEFKNFFPDNAVHYFVSYFDYYQPEAYIPRSDTYIEKDSALNEEIDRLRHAATDALLTRRDVIIVASVSCIYGIGSPANYSDLSVKVSVGEKWLRDKFMRRLTDIQYTRNDMDFHRTVFRVRGDVIDVFPASEEVAYRIEFFGDEIEKITKVDPLTGEIIGKVEHLQIFPSSHYVTPQEKLKVALGKIEQELDERLAFFKSNGQLLEAQRLEQRTRFDLEMLTETGFVKGIENYSRYLTNREQGEQPATLLDYYPDDFLMFVDESHMSMPQVRGMYNGDRARKEVLVDYGFRLPSALDNRPLTFTEFERHVNQVVYVSATPADYELSRSPTPAQQVIRPTGLLDPPIEVRPIDGQIDDLIGEIHATIDKHQRVLVTTLTKRMAEDLTDYLKDVNLKVAYLHSDIDTLERTDILRDLRLGTYDVLVGINLLREGLDLPEVSLVAILDADKEGFLRGEQALIQTVGRAARHEEGRVIMYADHVTDSMRKTIDETNRRRRVQEKYNQEHGITPTGIHREVGKGLRADLPEEAKKIKQGKIDLKKIPKDEYGSLIKDLTSQMDLASANLEFEKAAELRDIIADIKAKI